MAVQATQGVWPCADAEGGGRQWRLRRNCSLAPRQLIAVFLALCALSMGIAAGFWWLGAPAVLPFAGVELFALGLAFALYARHAGDGEHITLRNGELHVEHRCGGRVDRVSFRAEWVRVDSPREAKCLLAISGQGRQTLVGRYVSAPVRSRFALELHHALRAARCAGRPSESADLPHQAESLENRS